MKRRFFILSLIIISVISALLFCSCDKTPEINKYTLIYRCEIGGTIEGNTAQLITEGRDGITVTAVPDDGYYFVKWSDGKTDPTRTETNVTANITVTAIFKKLPNQETIFIITYLTDSNGTVEGEANQTVADGESSKSVTAVPNDGYKFVKWTDGVTNPTRQESNVKSDIGVMAIFEKLTYTVTYIAGENGTISGEVRQAVYYSESTTIVAANPKVGYRFVKWSDGITEPVRQETNIKTDLTLTAIFEKQIFNVIYVSDEKGKIDGETNQTIDYGKSASSVTAVPNEGYKFVKWSDGMTSATRTESYVTSNITVTAIFEKIYYTVRYGTYLYGTIEGEATQKIAYGEASTFVTAVPKEGYRFIEWSDGCTKITRQEKNVKSNILLTAKFEKVIFTAIYTFNGNGILDGETNQTINYGEASSTVTAIPDEGYRFVKWSDTGSTNPIRKDFNVKNDINATAIFDVLVLKVTYYISGGYFLVDGEEYHASYTQFANYGCDTTLKLKPILYNSGVDFTYKYVFLKWSDGNETEERQDFNVTEDISVKAIFGIKLTYAVDGDKGGKLIGNCTQVLEEGSDAEKVTAVADDGYVFDGWSDWSEQMMNPERQEKNVVKSTKYVAYFAPIEKTFKYDYGDVFGAPLQDKVVINRYKLKDVQFVLPELQGYEFCGWYTDKTYTTKFANENGKLMLGYYTFNLETDTIYAKWKSTDAEEKLIYKVLTVCVEEIQAPSLAYKDSQVEISFKTTAILRRLFSMYSVKVAEYLDEWFEGTIEFEVDTYFTIDILNEDNFIYDVTIPQIRASYLPEISDITESYRNTMTIYDYGITEYNAAMRSGAAGLGYRKDGIIFIDCMFGSHNNEVNIYVNKLEHEFYNEESRLWENEVTVYLHEFCHTIQFKYGAEVGDFHKVNYGSQFLDAKYYLLGIAVVDNKIYGIPSSYWTEGGKNMF